MLFVNHGSFLLAHRLGAGVCAILRLSGPLKEQYAQVAGDLVASLVGVEASPGVGIAGVLSMVSMTPPTRVATARGFWWVNLWGHVQLTSLIGMFQNVCPGDAAGAALMLCGPSVSERLSA